MIDARVVEIVGRMDAARTALRAMLAGIPRDLWPRAPADGRWPVAGVLDHLALVEKRIVELLREAVAAVPAPAAANPTVPHTVSLAVLTDRSRRVVTPGPFEPRAMREPDALIAELERVRAESLDFARGADADALATVQHPHFALGTLNGLQWLDFIGAHEARHTAQIVECVGQLRSSSA